MPLIPPRIRKWFEKSRVKEALGEFKRAHAEYTRELHSTTKLTEEVRTKILKEKLEVITRKSAILTEEIIKVSEGEGRAPSQTKIEALLKDLNVVMKATDGAAVKKHLTDNPPTRAVIDPVARTTEALVEASSKTITELAEKTLEGKSLKEFKDTHTGLERAVKEYAEAVDKGKATEAAARNMKELSSKIDNLLRDNPKLQDEITAKTGKNSRLTAALWKYAGFLSLTGLGALGLYLFLREIAKELTGCYQYTGTKSHKLPKGCSNPERCGCGNPSKATTRDELDRLCREKDPDSDDPLWKDYPFCGSEGCGPISPARPTCTDDVGKPTSVYYAWNEYSAGSIISSITEIVKELVATGITTMLKNVIIWVLIVVAILVALYIAFVVGKLIMNKMGKSNPG